MVVAGNCPVTSPSRKGLTPSSQGFRRSLAPLKFPDLNEYSEDAKPQSKSHGQLDQPSSELPSSQVEPAKSKSSNTLPTDQTEPASRSAPSVNIEEDALPPIPKRLVPSKSTERIMALLTERGLATSYDTPGSDSKSTEDRVKKSPVSSTPRKPRAGVSAQGLVQTFSLGEGEHLCYRVGYILGGVYTCSNLRMD